MAKTSSKSALFDRTPSSRTAPGVIDYSKMLSPSPTDQLKGALLNQRKEVEPLEEKINKIKEKNQAELLNLAKEDLIRLAINIFLEKRGLKQIKVEFAYREEVVGFDYERFHFSVHLDDLYIHESEGADSRKINDQFETMTDRWVELADPTLFSGTLVAKKNILGKIEGTLPTGERFTRP